MSIEIEELKTTDNSQQRSTSGTGLVATTQDSSMFAVGSHQLTADGRRQIGKLAAIFAGSATDSEQPKLLVVGHTDATGSAALNQRLSERRAQTVGKVLASAGIPASHIYFQGAGSSRPIGDNTVVAGRNKNRRVEIVEVTDEQMLAQRIDAEKGNSKYLAFGTSSAPSPVVSPKPVIKSGTELSSKEKRTTTAKRVESQASKSQSQDVRTPNNGNAKSKPGADIVDSTARVNFGGSPAHNYTASLGMNIEPKSGGFNLISKAEASDVPISSCLEDMPRQQGEVINLATNKPLNSHKTREYLPGYNNRVWANLVNGHLVTISPVSILKKNAAIDRQPLVQIVKGYDKGNRKALTDKYVSVANTYEGETDLLYRVFFNGKNTPVTCMDVVFSKGNAKAKDGVLFYSDSNQPYVAQYQPIRS
ncbi:hypothetical protein GCM10011502_02480 [Oceanisphaera marina]|uniref:OmpA-like domain-containing protein n=2 Tax=Oceanisphaera marina TaxID=2017550 RepID=A0ABQ1ID94_9GAMM|nr:hypothetical protein GCM10011502_02480 [Oceanisphaera marina]